MWPHEATFEVMKTVGVRELKDRLSEYLRSVRAGESILVTDRGEVIAELTPPGTPAADPHVPPGLLALARRGVLSLPTARRPAVYPLMKPMRGKRSSADLLDESRGTR